MNRAYSEAYGTSCDKGFKKTHELQQSNSYYIWKGINRGAGYGLELPWEYLFYRDDFSCEWLEQRLSKEGFDCTDTTL